MKVRQLAEATCELEEALKHYAEIHAEFAAALLDELARARRRIAELPQAWRPLGQGLRAFRLKRFPYVVIYRATPDEIVIVAFAHVRRRPGYWNGRLAQNRF